MLTVKKVYHDWWEYGRSNMESMQIDAWVWRVNYETNLPHILLEVDAYSKLHQVVQHIFLDSEKTITIFTNETSFALIIRGISPLTPRQIFQQFYY